MFRIKFVLISVILISVCLLFPLVGLANEAPLVVETEAQLREALAQLNEQGGSLTVQLAEDISVTNGGLSLRRERSPYWGKTIP